MKSEESERLAAEIRRMAAEAQACMEAEVAAANAEMNAALAQAQAAADQARRELEERRRAELAKLRARGIADPESFYLAAQAKGREFASREWERFERDALPRREAARAKLTGSDLEREMTIIDAEIDARLAIRAAEIARALLDQDPSFLG